MVCVSVVVAAGWLRFSDLFRDDFIRRIAMPVVLVLVPISIVVLLEAEGARKPASTSLLR